MFTVFVSLHCELVEEQVPPTIIGCPVNETITFPLDDGASYSTVDLYIEARDDQGQAVPVQLVESPAGITLPGLIGFTEGFREGERFTYLAMDLRTQESSTCTFIIMLEGSYNSDVLVVVVVVVVSILWLSVIVFILYVANLTLFIYIPYSIDQ